MHFEYKLSKNVGTQRKAYLHHIGKKDGYFHYVWIYISIIFVFVDRNTYNYIYVGLNICK